MSNESETMSRIAEYELFLLHAIIVAGKNAPFANAKCKQLLTGWSGTPFEFLHKHVKEGTLDQTFRNARTGNYRKMSVCIPALLARNINLETCWTHDLEGIPYLGLKTTRYFLLYTRPEDQTNSLAAIDTHVLKWLRENKWAQKRLKQLGINKVPQSTPSNPQLYAQLERVVCEYAKLAGMTARQWDSTNWDEKSKFTDLSRQRVVTVSP